MFAVTVVFTLKPGSAEAFLPLIKDNAATSLGDEPGCHQFDVCWDPMRPDEVFLYELYDDAAAFDAHLAADHFKAFSAASDALVANKQVRTYTQVKS